MTSVQSAHYWSATKAENTTNAWNVNFSTGSVANDSKANYNHAWCVRGGLHADQY